MKAFLAALLTSVCAIHSQVAPTEANLRAAAAAGGETKFSSSGTITLTSPVAFNLPTTLDADGHTIVIDGQKQSRLFEVNSGANLTLKGLALVNGWHRGTNSTADQGGPAGSAFGGAIQNLGGQVTAIGGSGAVNFQGARPFQYNNGGLAFGGAIYQTSGSLTIQGGAFVANLAGVGFGSGPAPAYGGAICSLNGNVVIIDATFCHEHSRRRR